MSPKKPSLKINAISNWATLGVNIIVGFVLTPFIISHLDKIGYGIWTLIGSFIGYYGLLNLGVDSALMRYVARYAGQGDKKALNETVSTAMVMFSCTGVLTIAISFLFAGPLAGLFKVEPEQFNDFIHAVWIIGIATGIGFSGNVFGVVIRAHERYVVANCASIATALVRACLVVFLLLSGMGLIGVAFATLGSQLCGFVLNYFLYRHLMSWVHVKLSFANKKTLKMLMAYGGVTTVIVIADILRLNIDSAVIARFVSFDAVAVYGVAALLIRYIIRVVVAGMGVLTPRFSNLEGAGLKQQTKWLFMKSLSISATISFGIAMLVLIFGRNFIIWWVGPEFSEAVLILFILVVPTAIAVSQGPGIGLMYALKKHHYYAVVSIAEAIANLTLSLILVRKYGIVGVALGTMISLLIVKIFVMPVYVSKIANVSLFNYIKVLIVPVIIASVIVVAIRKSALQIMINDCAIWQQCLCGLCIFTFFVVLNFIIEKYLNIATNE